MDKSTRRKAPGVLDQGPSTSGVQKGGPQEGSEGEEAPQSPWLSPKEVDEAVGECVNGDCEKAKAIIGVARLGEYGSFMLVRAGVAVLLEGRGLPRRRISQVVAVDGHRLKRLMELNEVLEFRLVSEFKPKTVFDAYWMYTSLVNLRLPFIVKSRFDPPNDVCGVFRDEGLCHIFIAGYLIAEASKSTKDPSRRFKRVGTSHSASVVTMLSIANHLAKHGIKTKVYINERQREVYFTLDDLPKDVERLIEDVWGNPTTLVGLVNEEFMTLLAGLIAGDGTVMWSSGNVEVVLTGNLEKEKPLYAVIRGELLRRFGVEATLYELKSAVRLRTWDYDAVRLLQGLPPLIEPLKELRRQLLLNKDRLGAYLASRLFDLLSDEKKNGEKGIHKLQSHQAVRFFTVLLRLGLIRLRKVEGFKYHIIETPTNPHGWAHVS